MASHTKISVVGLGYVGSVMSACLADIGHHVMGVDADREKVTLINSGMSPVIEPGLGDLIRKAFQDGTLHATQDIKEAVLSTSITLVCVGTPGKKDGGIDLSYIEKASLDIGEALRGKKDFHVVAIRSTVLPGVTRSVIIPALEKGSGKKAGKDFGVCSNPEFLREGSAITDFRYPVKIVIGESDKAAGDAIHRIYQKLPGAMVRTTIETAEMVKYADNSWHATKVAFANEIGNLCKTFSIDSHKVMEIFFKDTKLNISQKYLLPGFAFGGSCLPKDVRALNHQAKESKLQTPLLNALLQSNEEQIKIGLSMILGSGKKNIGFLGIAFKAGTDDLRESPIVELINRLLKHNLDLLVYDANVSMTRLPEKSSLRSLVSGNIDRVLKKSDVLVIGNKAAEFADIADKLRPEQLVIDFVRVREVEKHHKNYMGICW